MSRIIFVFRIFVYIVMIGLGLLAMATIADLFGVLDFEYKFSVMDISTSPIWLPQIIFAFGCLYLVYAFYIALLTLRRLSVAFTAESLKGFSLFASLIFFGQIFSFLSTLIIPYIFPLYEESKMQISLDFSGLFMLVIIGLFWILSTIAYQSASENEAFV